MWRRKDVRLEVTRDKVCGCRDSLCMGDVYVAAGERVFLCVRGSGVFIIWKGVDELTVNVDKV